MVCVRSFEKETVLEGVSVTEADTVKLVCAV